MTFHNKDQFERLKEKEIDAKMKSNAAANQHTIVRAVCLQKDKRHKTYNNVPIVCAVPFISCSWHRAAQWVVWRWARIKFPFCSVWWQLLNNWCLTFNTIVHGFVLFIAFALDSILIIQHNMYNILTRARWNMSVYSRSLRPASRILCSFSIRQSDRCCVCVCVCDSVCEKLNSPLSCVIISSIAILAVDFISSFVLFYYYGHS